MGIFSKKPKYAFSEILRGLYHAVGSAQEMLQAQQVQNLKKFWQDTDGSPICQKVKVGDKEIDVPLMALVSHCQMDDIKMTDNDVMDITIRFKLKATSAA